MSKGLKTQNDNDKARAPSTFRIIATKIQSIGMSFILVMNLENHARLFCKCIVPHNKEAKEIKFILLLMRKYLKGTNVVLLTF